MSTQAHEDTKAPSFSLAPGLQGSGEKKRDTAKVFPESALSGSAQSDVSAEPPRQLAWTDTKDPVPAARPADTKVEATARRIAVKDMKVPDDAGDLDPAEIAAMTHDAEYAVLKGVFKQSWHLVKHHLVEATTGTPTQIAARTALATKLIEYRNWAYEKVLEAAAADVNAKRGAGAAEPKAKNKGSTELTSDVDLMLQGDQTEFLVAKFNELFKKGTGTGHPFNFEPGIVLDVNAYEKGYVTDPDRAYEKKDTAERKTGVKLPLRQGARDMRPEGGIGTQEHIEKDRQAQTEGALLKLRLYMTGNEWKTYVDAVRASDESTVGMLERGNALFVQHYETLAAHITGKKETFPAESKAHDDKTGAEMLQAIAETKAAAGSEKKSDAAPDQKLDAKELLQEPETAATVLMAASNREAEKLLETQLFPLRMNLVKLIEQENTAVRQAKAKGARVEPAELEAIRVLENLIGQRFVELRQVAARVQALANEAYLTDAGLHHAVVGLQAGQGIQLTKAELLQVLIENMGDALKELGRYGSPEEEAKERALEFEGKPKPVTVADEALYKASKYILRLADAAMSMGYGYIGAVQILYDVGRMGSIAIKGSSAVSAGDKAAATRGYANSTNFDNLLKDHLAGGSRVDAIRKAVLEAGTSVQVEFQLERRWTTDLEQDTKDEASFQERQRQTTHALGTPVLSKKQHADTNSRKPTRDELPGKAMPGGTIKRQDSDVKPGDEKKA